MREERALGHSRPLPHGPACRTGFSTGLTWAPEGQSLSARVTPGEWMGIAILVSLALAVPGTAPAPAPEAAAVVPRTAEPVANQAVVRPEAVGAVAQPAPGADVPEKPRESPAGSPGSPPPAPTDAARPADPAPPADPVAASPSAGSASASGAAPPPVAIGPAAPAGSASPAPGFSVSVAPTTPGADPTPPPAEPGTRGALPWLPLAGLLLAGIIAAAAAKAHRARLVRRTRAMLALKPSLDTGRGPLRAPGLAFAGPSTSIRSRLEPGALRWRA